MRWIVGLDLNPHAHGALRFTRWLAQACGTPAAERFIGVHVLEEEHLRAVLRTHHLDEVVAAAERAATDLLAREGPPQECRDLEVVQDVQAEDGLAAACERHRAGAIVVGRRAGRETHAVVRLGRVCRRLLRDLPAPVVVVPPDLTTDDIGDGPIVALTRLTDDSVAAARFAQELASRLGRQLLLLHVLPDPATAALALYLATATDVEAGSAEALRRAEAATAEWAARAGLAPAATRVVLGGVIERTLEIAEEERAALLVVGSRHLSQAQRVVVASTGSGLAGVARRPVAVVPPAATPA